MFIYQTVKVTLFITILYCHLYFLIKVSFLLHNKIEVFFGVAATSGFVNTAAKKRLIKLNFCCFVSDTSQPAKIKLKRHYGS